MLQSQTNVDEIPSGNVSSKISSANVSTLKDRQRRIKGLLGLLYITLCTMGIMYAPQPLLNAIHLEFNTSESTTALLISVSMLPLAIAPLFYGPVLGLISSRTVLACAVSLLILSGIPLYYATSFTMLLVVRFLQGLLFPAVYTALMTHISNKFSGGELQRAMGLYIGATILGGLLGRLTAGALASWLGWRMALLLLCTSLIPALWTLFRLHAETRTAVVHHRFSEFFVVLREPGMGILLAIESILLFVFTAVSNFIPFRMAEIGAGGSEFRIGLMYSGYLMGVLVACCSRQVIALFHGESRLLMAGMALYLLCFPLMLAPSALALFGAMWLICLAQFTVHTNVPGIINRLTSKDKGMVNGLYLTCYYTGGVLGSYLPGLMYDAFGWHMYVFSLLGLILIVLGLSIRLHRHSTLS